MQKFSRSHWLIFTVNLTNRFHVAVRLFNNRSQMTLKCGKHKKVAHEALAECVTDVLAAIPDISQCANSFLTLGKVEFF